MAWAFGLAASAVTAAFAAVERVIVTASLPPRAMEFYRELGERLTPQGERFVRSESGKLRDGKITTSDLLPDAKQACANALRACRGKDDLALASYTLAEAAYGIDNLRWLANLLSPHARQSAYEKAAGNSDFQSAPAQTIKFPAKVLANMTPKDREAMLAYMSRQRQLRSATFLSLKSLGFPDTRTRKN